MSNKLEQFKFKLEKNIGIQKHAGKVRKSYCVDDNSPSKNTYYEIGLVNFLSKLFNLKIQQHLYEQVVERFEKV